MNSPATLPTHIEMQHVALRYLVLAFGGSLGGTLPFALTIVTKLSADEKLPGWWGFIFLGYAFLGGVTAVMMKASEFAQAIVTGIAAPGLIAGGAPLVDKPSLKPPTAITQPPVPSGNTNNR